MGGESKDCFDLYNSSHAARGAGEGTAYATNRVYSADIYAAEAAKLIAAHGRDSSSANSLNSSSTGGKVPLRPHSSCTWRFKTPTLHTRCRVVTSIATPV